MGPRNNYERQFRYYVADGMNEECTERQIGTPPSALSGSGVSTNLSLERNMKEVRAGGYLLMAQYEQSRCHIAAL